MTGSFTVPPAHPSLPGHFPGDPIVPGVVLLDEVLVRLPGATLETAKFTAPVRPGETVDLRCTATPGWVNFACTVAGRPVLRGTARLPP